MGYEIGDSYVHDGYIILNQHLSLRNKEYEDKVLYNTVIWTYLIIRDFFDGSEDRWGPGKG